MMLAEMVYDGELSASAYIILTAMFLIIGGGLAWCFYRALKATDKDAQEQLPDEV
ncbi:MAG: hypothetical protein JW860_11070 [Sedimentisphaerales bacterium]|nr:hypothetical protein [Sedimentisphaerales bacterium]